MAATPVRPARHRQPPHAPPAPGYGPRASELQVSQDGKTFETVKAFDVPKDDAAAVEFEPTRATVFRVVFYGAFDPVTPDRPRNVQVAEVTLAGPDGAGRPARPRGRA